MHQPGLFQISPSYANSTLGKVYPYIPYIDVPLPLHQPEGRIPAEILTSSPPGVEGVGDVGVVLLSQTNSLQPATGGMQKGATYPTPPTPVLRRERRTSAHTVAEIAARSSSPAREIISSPDGEGNRSRRTGEIRARRNQSLRYPPVMARGGNHEIAENRKSQAVFREIIPRTAKKWLSINI